LGRLVRSGRLLPAERVSAHLEAEGTLERAREEARRIVEAARSEAEGVHEAARRKARETVAAETAALVAEASAARERALSGLRDDVVDLAMAVGRKVIGRELEVSRTAAVEICAGALRRLRRARAVVVHVHPDDLGAVETGRPLLADILADEAGLRVVGDESVGRGGCLIESDVGRIDARLDAQLDAIERALEDGLE
jgi:type III secretion protein L